jgi:hypothetical protein
VHLEDAMPILPPEIYAPLEESEFGKLRDAIKKIFEELP